MHWNLCWTHHKMILLLLLKTAAANIYLSWACFSYYGPREKGRRVFLWVLKMTKYLLWIISLDFHFMDEETEASRE